MVWSTNVRRAISWGLEEDLRIKLDRYAHNVHQVIIPNLNKVFTSLLEIRAA